MVLNIIFSFNRAMQLDYLLQSVIERFKFEYKTVILYHTTGEHKKGYNLLKQKYASNKQIEFCERKNVLFDLSYLHTFTSKKNIQFFKDRNFFKKNGDNFKGLTQRIIKESNCEFVMFNTDDGYFFEDVKILETVFNIINKNPENASYRLYVGENLDEHPDFVKKQDGYLQWDYFAEKEIHHWTYPFSVDGTIYSAKGLLKYLKKIPYHNPVTLEDHVVKYFMQNKIFSIGLSPIQSQLIATKLNRVSVDTMNPTIHIKPEFLNEKFINGYTLRLEIPTKITNANIVPDKIFIVKGTLEELIYQLDEQGQKVQNLLGKEGSIEQLE